jgi:RNA polymerase sigma factor (sigma-70 family)
LSQFGSLARSIINEPPAAVRRLPRDECDGRNVEDMGSSIARFATAQPTLVLERVSARQFDDEFRAVFDARFAELFRWLDRYSGDASLAADVAQETFVRLYQRGEMPADLRAWLVSVALNLVRDEQRRGARRRRLLQRRAVADTMADAAPSPEDDVLAAERRSLVRRALYALPERDRALLLLREEGYSYRELSSALSVVETSVGTMLARAKVAFRESYDSAERNDAARRTDDGY